VDKEPGFTVRERGRNEIAGEKAKNDAQMLFSIQRGSTLLKFNGLQQLAKTRHFKA
jgi:hypothetical protein